MDEMTIIKFNKSSQALSDAIGNLSERVQERKKMSPTLIDSIAKLVSAQARLITQARISGLLKPVNNNKNPNM